MQLKSAGITQKLGLKLSVEAGTLMTGGFSSAHAFADGYTEKNTGSNKAMNKIFQTPLDSASTEGLEVVVAAGSGAAGSQSVLRPPDYSMYRFRCVVDFLRIKVTLQKASNFQSVKRITAATLVEAVDEGPGRAAKTFIIRFDDPACRAAVREAIAKLGEKSGGFLVEPVLVELEVALDCYSLARSKAELLTMTERFFRFGSCLCSDNMRMSGGKGEVYWAEEPLKFRRRLDRGFTIYVGNSVDPISQKIYFKTTDQNGKVKLLPSEHRARREVTIKGAAFDDPKNGIPSVALSFDQPWKFEALSKWFRFRKLKLDLNEEPMQRVMASLVVLQGVHNDKRPGRRLYGPRTLSDTVLNDIARTQLKELTRRFASVR